MVSSIQAAPRGFLNSLAISGWSRESIGRFGRSLGVSVPASTVWPSSNLAILVPFEIDLPFTVASLFSVNGSVVSGNMDIGIYDDGDGSNTVNRLLSLGSTAQAGTGAPQAVAAALTLTPGRYYAAMALDNVTGTTFARPSSAVLGMSAGLAQAALGSVVLPSTITLAKFAQANIPFFGLSQKASL